MFCCALFCFGCDNSLWWISVTCIPMFSMLFLSLPLAQWHVSNSEINVVDTEPRLNIRAVCPRYGDSHVIFSMGIPILVRRYLYIETAPWMPLPKYQITAKHYKNMDHAHRSWRIMWIPDTHAKIFMMRKIIYIYTFNIFIFQLLKSLESGRVDNQTIWGIEKAFLLKNTVNQFS